MALHKLNEIVNAPHIKHKHKELKIDTSIFEVFILVLDVRCSDDF